MTLALIGAVLGIFLGWRRAKSKGGNRADIAQYAAVYCIAFALAGFIISVILVRTLAG